MMVLLKSWVLRLTGACILTAIAAEISPEGRGKAVVRLVCGFVILAALISPLKDFDYSDYSRLKVKYAEDSLAVASSLEETDNRLLRNIIESKSEEYIMDKGSELGIGNLSADVDVKWSGEGYWYPWSVSLHGQGDFTALSDMIEAQLGIPAERQMINGS